MGGCGYRLKTKQILWRSSRAFDFDLERNSVEQAERFQRVKPTLEITKF